MNFLQDIKLIQGGMGVYVSNWRMARAVAMEKPGVAAGTVSGTALDVVYIRLLQLGDPGGHVGRALSAFDAQFGVAIGRKIYDRYYIEGGKAPKERFKNSPRQALRLQNDSGSIPAAGQQSEPLVVSPDEELIELYIASGFAEVWLAKESHDGLVFINFLRKIELPLIYTMYGAMLAGVDGIVVGAGNPDGLPAVRSRLANHEMVSTSLSVLYREKGEMFELPFDPRSVAAGKLAQKKLKRPAFLAIVSLEGLVSALAQSSSEAPDGFVIEHHTAGGHNAPPVGSISKDAFGQPQYSEKDEPDLEAIRQIGLPFWLAGGYGSQQKLQQALSLGANGVQVGSVFALTEESGMKPAHRAAVFEALKDGVADDDLIRTTMFSPTGFPFKVVQLAGTLSDEGVYEQRRRVCDIGHLQQRGLSKADQNGNRHIFQRCPAEPLEAYAKKRGLPPNTQEKRCLCNGLLSGVGLGQISIGLVEEPPIVTLGNYLGDIRRLSRNGQSPYWVRDVIGDIFAF